MADGYFTRLEVSNFRSLGESVQIPLGRRLTALVGHNGAGKSSIIDALRFLSDCARDGLSAALTRRNGLDTLRRRGGQVIRFFLEYQTGFGLCSWALALREDKRGDVQIDHDELRWLPERNGIIQLYIHSYERAQREAPSHPLWSDLLALLRGDRGDEIPSVQEELQARTAIRNHSQDKDSLALVISSNQDPLSRKGPSDFLSALRSLSCYAILPEQLRPPQRPDVLRRAMDEHGANWTTTLRRLDRAGGGQELLAGLGRIVGDIQDYRVQSVGGYLVAEFCHGSDCWLNASQESDGTLRVAALLTALLQEPPLSLLGIEEPELNVHPGVLPVLFDFLREASQRSQVVLTTHSPDLLDLLDPDEILIVSRHDTTHVGPLARAQRAAAKQHLMSTSELLRAEGLHQEASEQRDDE